jgi:hypothetical protein
MKVKETRSRKDVHLSRSMAKDVMDGDKYTGGEMRKGGAGLLVPALLFISLCSFSNEYIA